MSIVSATPLSRDGSNLCYWEEAFLTFKVAGIRAEDGDRIWVGDIGGLTGQWMTSSQVRTLAAILNRVADLHDQLTII